MDYTGKDSESRAVLPLYKKRGETLAVFVDRIRAEENLGTVPLTYAGRLDPMADGLMIVLAGGARFEKEKYLSLEKEYTFQILFGISTDTFDALGRIRKVAVLAPDLRAIERALSQVQRARLPYPPFSSKPVAGKPLFLHARAETLPETLPLQQGKILELRLIEYRTAPLGPLIEEIKADVQRVEGDFRQPLILADWDRVQKDSGEKCAVIVTAAATVASGVYIRSIAEAVGELLSVPAFALRITRTRIGSFLPEHL